MSDLALDTVVAGVRCREVLAELSGFLDGELSPGRVAELQAHLLSCDRCARFGADVATVLRMLRDGLRVPLALPDDIATRLHHRIADVTGA